VGDRGDLLIRERGAQRLAAVGALGAVDDGESLPVEPPCRPVNDPLAAVLQGPQEREVAVVVRLGILLPVGEDGLHVHTGYPFFRFNPYRCRGTTNCSSPTTGFIFW